MKISIKKQIEEQIEIETPILYKRWNQFIKITELHAIQVMPDSIITYSTSDTMFENIVNDRLGSEKISENMFNEAYLKSMDNINHLSGIAGIYELPTIFTQNKFRSLQTVTL